MDKVQFDELKTLEEATRKAKYLYGHNKGRPVFQKSWDDKKKRIKEPSHLSS